MGPSGQWGARATSQASAMAAIFLTSVKPPAWDRSGWMISTPPGAQQTLEVPAGVEPFAGGNGDVAGRSDFREVLHVLAQNGLFQEHGVEFLQLLGQNLGHGLVDPAVEVNGNAEVFAAGFPNAGHPLQDLVNLGIGVDELQLFRGIHLDGSKAGVLLFQGGLAHIGGTVARPIQE